jgi:predicted component of type VI protein secretion system
MQGDAIAMLFAPPQPPVSLPREGEVVLGRSRECAVRLGDADTSRRHAKIVCSGGRFVLHDLGSTNGTFVNGERIGERELEPGDRLQIGEMGRKTGLLRIESDTAPGRLWLRGGDPIHAETKTQVGFDAAVALVNATAGRFAFEPNAPMPDATIQASVTHLLLEASRQLDEGLVG